MASVPTTMASFMAAVREITPKQPGESDDDYKDRLYTIARPAFEQFMARQRQTLLMTGQATASAGFRPGTQPEPYTVPVSQELRSDRQTKLNRMKERYAR
jgi:hypothetical protein